MKKYLFLSAFLIGSCIAFTQTDDCACCSDSHMAFDFWLGDWEVTNTDGSPAGKNTIVKDQKGCILKENWTSATAGYTGASTNFYNLRTQQWEQLWIDNSGNHLKLKGNRVGNQMILASDEFLRPDGKAYINRITWTANADGTVRQLWEVLQDDKVVSVSFDGLYRKVN
ncbi:hypothetical protein [Muriicola sp. Z0-33]|uniref:hypothetical protein n=1 Tax=Muriicola sp. Z0-33 TaxID=2816957 RepID=UPI0022384216|nr:hypothetical protein [Muriicola sp. Z0-33]MCW5517597.1 hypothetical protein [Muriicola sp. Z0-33]